MVKRLFDAVFSLFWLAFFSPLVLLIVLLVKRDSRGPVFYRSARVGQYGRIFRMYKFRTMVVNADKIGGPSTSADDPRLTKLGSFLRKHNIDELPQFLNILKCEMSFVGPRPEVLQEVEIYEPDTKKRILSVKPGMTDLATLANLHEEEVLKGSKDPHQAYQEKIKPEKIRLALEYVKKQSFLLDMKILLKTVVRFFK